MNDKIQELTNDIEKVSEHLPQYVTTIYDIQTCLGAAILSDKSGNIPLDVAMKTDFETMHEALGTEDGIVIVDLLEEDDELKFDGISIEDYTAEKSRMHPFSYGYNWGTGPTITHYSNRKKPKEIAYYDTGNDEVRRSETSNMTYTPLTMLYKWPDSATESSLYDDKDIPRWLDLLQSIPQSTIKEIEDAIVKKLPKTKFEGFFSIRVNGDPPSEFEDYRELYSYMVRSDEETKNKYTSVGSSVDIVSNAEGEMLGVSNGPAWDYQTSKTRENHPRFNPSDNWRHRPLSLDTSLLMKYSQDMLENDFTYQMMFGEGNNVISVYYYAIPYPKNKEISPELVARWYRTLRQIFNEGETEDWKPDKLKKAMSVVESDDSDQDDGPQFLKNVTNNKDILNSLYMSVQREGSNVDNELFTQSVNQDELQSLMETTTSIVKNRSSDIGFRNNIQNPDFESFSTIATTLLNPKWHADNNCYKQDSDNRKRDSQSVEFQISQALISDSKKVSYPQLIQAFSQRLQSEMYDGLDLNSIHTDSDEKEYNKKYGFIDASSNQDITLGVLLETDSLSNYRATTKDMDISCLSPRMRRKLRSRPEILVQDENNGQRSLHTATIYPFVLGSVVGEISKEQAKRGVADMLYLRNPIDYVSKVNIQSVMSDVLDKIFAYSGQNNSELESEENIYSMFQYELGDISYILQESPNVSEWNISDEEIRYFYGIGMATSFME